MESISTPRRRDRSLWSGNIAPHEGGMRANNGQALIPSRSFPRCWYAVPLQLLVMLCFLYPFAQLRLHAQAQAFNASLSGTVYDSTGAVVPKAKVTLSNPARGFERTFDTTSDGRYAFTLVPPGTYALTVQGSGFTSYNQTGIDLQVGQSATQDVTLQLGAVTQQVTVSASAEILETSNANIASTVSNRQTVELPLNLRNIYGLVSLNSSVNNSQQYQALNPPGSQGVADQDIAFFNFGGGRFGATAFLLDGAWDAAGDWAGIEYVPGVDETQEYKIQTNSFTAQYGWSMGNAVNAVTKSGTSSLHGDAYEFNRNNAWDANNYFNNAAHVPEARFARNQFGFTIGGPIYIPKLFPHKDKLFFFADYEGLREATPLTLTTTVPTSAMRSGDFSGLLGAQIGTDDLGRPILSGQLYNPFTTRTITAGQVDPTTGLVATASGIIRDPITGNKISAIDPVAKNFIQYWPSPISAGTVSNYTASGGAPTEQNSYTGRIDLSISEKSRLFARWSQKFEFKQLEGDFYGTSDVGGPGTKAPDNRWDIGFGYDRVFNPTFIMDIDLGWARWAEGRLPEGVPFQVSTTGLPTVLDTFGGPPAFPSITIDGQGSLGSGGLNATPREARTLALDFTKVHGAHSLMMGFMGIDFILNTFNSSQASFNFPVGMTQGPDPTAANPLTGFGFASFLLGTGNSGGITLNAEGAFQKAFYGWYLQDDWKATRKLTLNLGLRYDFQTAPTDRFNRYSWFNPTATNPISSQVGMTVPGELVYTSPSHRGIYDPQYSNFAPRVGFAYQLASKLVMRGGFGMFYIPAIEFGDYQGMSLNGFTQTTPYVGTINGYTPVNLLSNPFPNGLLLPPGKAAGALTNVGYNTNGLFPNRPTPYIEQWSLGFQYELSRNDMIDVTYVGNHGVKLPLSETAPIDMLPTADLSLGTQLLTPVTNPFYPAITSSGCGLNSAQVQREQLLLPYPEFCGVNGVQITTGVSSYNGLQVNFNHRWSGGLQMLLSYTYSKYLDEGSGSEGWTSGSNSNYENIYNIRNEYSNDIDDIPHSFVASYIYELPYGKGKHFGSSINKWANGILGGWQVTGITTFKSGFPMGITATSDNLNNYGGAQRPNLIGNPKLANPTVAEWFNVAAFAQPAAYTFGNVPRTMPDLRAPGLNNWDLAIQKYFTWRERFKLQFRAEMFNAFNHAILYEPNTSFGSPTFGTITGAYAARDVQMAFKLFW